FFQAEDGIRDRNVTGVQTCALPISMLMIYIHVDVLIIFYGPHGYISSTWYETEDVPTWDYQSIHVYGKSVLLNEHQLKQDLKVLLDKYESKYRGGATWENLSDQTKKQIKGIVGFKVKVDKLEAAYKLSQNRSETDKENIVIHLNNTESDLDKNLA